MKTTKLLWQKISDVPKSYEALCRVYLPRRIHDNIELENATEVADFLAGHNLNADQEDYLDLVASLIADYEDEHDPMPDRSTSGIVLLTHLLEVNELNAADLSRILGVDRSLGPKILRQERSLTPAHMKKLGLCFAVDPGVFLP